MNLRLESQYTPCPKCHYSRKTTDLEPDYQCPSCGVVYKKYIHHQEDIQHPENSQNNRSRLTPQVDLSHWEKFKLAVCLSSFLRLVPEL